LVVLHLRVSADEPGIAVLAAAARAAVASRNGNGDAAGLVLQLVGLDARERSRGGQDDTHIELSSSVDGTEVILQVRDRGEPLNGPAPTLEPLLELGVMTSARAFIEGTGNVTEMRFAMPSHSATLDSGSLEVLGVDTPLSSEEVTMRSLVASDAASLTRCIYRSYGWTYPHPDLYYPERVAASITSGRRVGEVAVTADGEVVGHWGAIFLTPTLVESGLALTDPRFRRRGIAAQLQARVTERLNNSDIVGRVGEPVLTHTATQELVLRSGGAIVGAYLSYGVPVAQVGITDGMLAGRRSLAVHYIEVKPMTEATLWIPRAYEPFVRMVLAHCDWPRSFGEVHRMGDTPDETLLDTTLDSFNKRGEIDVRQIGLDLIEVVDTALDSLRRSGAEVVHVRLPANDPALAVLGEGLTVLGLAYSVMIPSFSEAGDALVLKWIADPEIDTSSWHYYNDDIAQLIGGILGQVHELSDRGAQQRRRAGRRAALFAALDT